jgi:hypothetical protein
VILTLLTLRLGKWTKAAAKGIARARYSLGSMYDTKTRRSRGYAENGRPWGRAIAM